MTGGFLGMEAACLLRSRLLRSGFVEYERLDRQNCLWPLIFDPVRQIRFLRMVLHTPGETEERL